MGLALTCVPLTLADTTPGDVLIFLGAALLVGGPIAVWVLFLFRKMDQASITGTQMTRNAEALLRAFAVRVGAWIEQPRRDVWGTVHPSKVHGRCHEVDFELSVGFIQGSSVIERIVFPLLTLRLPGGGVWPVSPKAAITQALAGIGHSARRVEAGVLAMGGMQHAYSVQLDSPEKRTGGNFIAPLVEVVIDVETLVLMVDVICRAARSVVVAGQVPAGKPNARRVAP